MTLEILLSGILFAKILSPLILFTVHIPSVIRLISQAVEEAFYLETYSGFAGVSWALLIGMLLLFNWLVASRPVWYYKLEPTEFIAIS